MNLSGNIRALRQIVPRLEGSPCGPKAVWVLPEGTSEAWSVWRDGNAVSVAKARVSAGSRFPIHLHGEDECLIVYRGIMGIDVGDGEQLLKPGEGIHIPKGVAHQVRSVGNDDLCLVVVHVPFGKGMPE